MRTAPIRSAPWLALAFAATILFGATTTHAQKDSSPRQKASSQSSTPVELTGCVSGRPAADGTFTLTDAQNGGKYRLTGKRMQKYAGRMVAVVGGPTKKLTVSGGLWPSPNAAGQAGALDPAQESIARQPGGGARRSDAGAVDLPPFNVVRVRTLDGACR
jgi:hypothetical protein